MKNWIEISVHLDPAYLERVSSHLFALGCQGIHERADDFVLYFAAADWNNDKLLLLQDYLQRQVAGFDSAQLVVGKIDDQNWNENWKDSFKTFHLNEKIVIAPAWDNYQAVGDEIVLRINPQMAFGTGHHETTQLALLLLQDYLKKGMTVLDAGTGSAILAIYAALAGAKSIVAFDNDPVAIENAVENCRLNQVLSKINLFTGTLQDVRGQAFDCITANINKNILLDLAAGFKGLINATGILILSGLLLTDVDEIVKVYETQGWRLLEQRQRNEWAALVFDVNR